MNTVPLTILAYLAVAICIGGLAWRCIAWMRSGVPLQIPLTPAPLTRGGVWGRMAKEVLGFHNLFRADRSLWAVSWIFHASLALVIVGHVAGLVAPEMSRSCVGCIKDWGCSCLGAMGMSVPASQGLTPEAYHRCADVLGCIFGVIAMISLVVLLLRRVILTRVRYISTFGDYFALLLLLAVVITGNRLRFSPAFDVAEAHAFVVGLLTFHPVRAPADPLFAEHLVGVSLLLAYLPFSKLVHLGGIFFSPTLNQTYDVHPGRHIRPWTSPSSNSGSVARTDSSGL